MTFTNCERLAPYLFHDLPPDQCAEFEHHLAECDSCRLAVEQNTQIDQLLKTLTERITCPSDLPARIRRERDRFSRRHSRKGSLVAASLVMGLLGWSLLMKPPHRETSAPENPRVSRKPAPDIGPKVPESPDGKREVTLNQKPNPVQVEFPEEVLSLPIESGEPDITLIQLFPVGASTDNR